MKDKVELRPTNFKYFKYGLPIPNMDPGFKTLPEMSEEMFPKPITDTENLMTALQISENTEVSYDDFEDRLLSKYNFEEDMYGEIINNEDVRNAMINEFNEDIVPAAKLKNNEYMDAIRDWRQLNLNMPGTLENEDPNRF